MPKRRSKPSTNNGWASEALAEDIEQLVQMELKNWRFRELPQIVNDAIERLKNKDSLQSVMNSIPEPLLLNASEYSDRTHRAAQNQAAKEKYRETVEAIEKAARKLGSHNKTRG